VSVHCAIVHGLLLLLFIFSELDSKNAERLNELILKGLVLFYSADLQLPFFCDFFIFLVAQWLRSKERNTKGVFSLLEILRFS
jgi:hypothetical protein